MHSRVLCAVLFLGSITLVEADDGWVGYTGSPKPMGSHPSVRMVSEIVRVVVHRDTADVTCDFVFKNEGPRTTVRMGFPDYDEHYQSVKDLDSTYDYFKSYVDGKRVRCHLQPVIVKDASYREPVYQEAYQVKSVAFGQHQTRHVREVYRLRLGSIALWGDVEGKGTPAYDVLTYIFSTGATWKGSIRRAEMVVTFGSDSHLWGGKPRLMDRPEPRNDDYETHDWWRWAALHPYAVVDADDFTVHDRTLRFVKRNWEPTEEDDVQMSFGYYFRKE